VLSQIVRVVLDTGEIVALGPSEIAMLAPPSPVEDREETKGRRPDPRVGRNQRSADANASTRGGGNAGANAEADEVDDDDANDDADEDADEAQDDGSNDFAR
jgi:hypothetical protein